MLSDWLVGVLGVVEFFLFLLYFGEGGGENVLGGESFLKLVFLY